MPAVRVHAIAGASNFRDFGGYGCAARGTLRERRLFRSAHLAGLTPEGARAVAGLGIATVIDLRGVEERGRAPAAHVEAHSVRVLSAPIEPGASPRIARLHAEGRLGGAAMRDIMIGLYRGFVRSEAPAFGRALALMAEAGESPLLVHCTAGKDRTGFIVALVHALLGVPREAILADYVATNAAWDRASVPGLTIRDEAAREALLTADPDYLEAAFEEIERLDGTAEAFAERAAGAAVLQRLECWLHDERE